MNFILGADIGGPCNDFVESVTLYEYKDLEDLANKVEKDWAGWEIMFYKPETIKQARRHVGFFQEYIEDPDGGEDTDSWRLSVGRPMIKYNDKDVLVEKDFNLRLEEICGQL